MVWVNLLPWRAERLKSQGQRWLLAIVGLMLMLLTASVPLRGQQMVNQQSVKLIEQLKQAQQSAKQRLKQLTSLETEREALRHSAANQLRRRETLKRWSLFLHNLTEAMPDTLWLTGLTKSQQSLTVSGICQCISDLDAFRQRLQEMALIGQVKIGPLSRSKEGQMLFHLLASLTLENSADE
ncbi:PilN domain-containing protein [Erwinia sp. P7711]|uniref:PilN domain-containing protein n=1 Tax=Erwinia sp. P7711 TaxID=3141451 RepID=UPI00318DB95F